MQAIVSSLAPLKVVVKGTTTAVPVWRIASHVPAPSVGDRVWITKSDRKIILHAILQVPA